MDDLKTSLTSGSLSRRDFVRRAALLGLSLPVASSLLAACGGDDDDDDEPTPTESGGAGSPEAEATSTLQILAPVPTSTPRAAASPEGTEASSPEATTAATTPPTEAGTKGGSVVFLREGDADNGTYDPVLSDDNDVIWVLFSVYETLVKANPEGAGIDPGLAETWEITEDAMTATFNLRPGIKFSDGTDLTTDDVIFSLERARDTETSPWAFSLAQAQEITAPDDATIVVNLSEPYMPLFAALAMFNSGIISKAFFEANATESDDELFGGLAITTGVSGGAGPYAITKWEPTVQTVLTRNEYYWDEGKPYLDEIVLRTVPDANSMILQLQGGDVDGVIGQNAIPYNRVEELQGDSNLQVYISPASQSSQVTINTNYHGVGNPLEPRMPFADLNFRKAMAHAIDYQTLIDTVQFGIAVPSGGLMPVGSMFWNPDLVLPEFNLDKAREFLAASESPDGGAGEIQITTGNAQQEALATSLQAMWKEINFEATIGPYPAAVGTQRRTDGEYDMRIASWTNDMIDPDQILSYYVVPDASANARTGYLDQEAVDMVIAARSETDEDARRELYYQVQERWLEGPMFFLYNVPYTVALNKRIKGYHQNPLGPWYLADIYIEE
jgi:peptide/nickel transport system substrate-binding protein